jgi:N4-gp56 family major capsid protein
MPAGTLVNTLGGYANNATGAVEAFGTDTLQPQLKTFYDTALLKNVKAKDAFTQVAMKQRLPAKNGITVEWRKWNDLPDAAVLVEGIIPTGHKMGQTTIVVSVVQYGLYVTLSDRFMLHAIDDGVLAATERVGNSCVRTMQKIVRTALMEGTNFLFAAPINLSTGALGERKLSRAALTDSATAACYLHGDDFLMAATMLETGNAEKFEDGNFVCLAHPHVIHDLKQSKAWREQHMYNESGIEKIYKNEEGLYWGFRVIKSDLCPVIRGADLTAAKRNLTVKTTLSDAGKTVAVKEAITAAEATALADREIYINGVLHEIASAASGAAGSATITTVDNVAVADGTANNVIAPGDGTTSGGAVYGTFFMGKDAFAAVEPEGANLRTIIKTPAQIGGALEQFGTVGAKFESAAKILYQTQILRLESASSFSAKTNPN